MKIVQSLDSKKTILSAAIVLATFIIYPNIVNTFRTYFGHGVEDTVEFFSFFFFRYIFFGVLIWGLLTLNIKKIRSSQLSKRLLVTFAITVVAYGVYILISLLSKAYGDCFTGVLLFQFVVSCLLCAFVGHVYVMYLEQRNRDLEIEQLKLENLQSRYDALTNQINPHFLFNTINGLTALVRNDEKQKTLQYTSKMSALFRYILQSEKKGLVPLKEELDFLESYRYLLEVRYAEKLSFQIDIPDDKLAFEIPVLSLLPVIENVVKHNVIDCEHPMLISVSVGDSNELIITNPIQEKIDKPIQNGVGLPNLSARFRLLLDREVKVENDGQIFKVCLPLKYPEK
ncbi:histidine kinase [Parabacteroides sp. OttesenSCG-928-G07]|nr:histidine kinase [Parabacteroides sp. OttesenSCG-928-G21]MDL2278697.1 histidine kinase [Parabacteroides sp. OttesenSCG-928-G07]